MKNKLLSKRYAEALFGLAVENNILEKIITDIKLVSKVYSESRELRVVIANPVIDEHKKKSIFKSIFSDKVQELTLRFLLLITRKSREIYIHDICDAFIALYKEYKNILTVELITAQKTGNTVTSEISKKLQKATNMNIEIVEKIKEDIIGGFIINYNDYQYDASVSNQLNKLKKGFSENLYKIQF